MFKLRGSLLVFFRHYATFSKKNIHFTKKFSLWFFDVYSDNEVKACFFCISVGKSLLGPKGSPSLLDSQRYKVSAPTYTVHSLLKYSEYFFMAFRYYFIREILLLTLDYA